METITRRQARRLALVQAGLLKKRWTGMPRSVRGRGRSARRACHEVIRRFGYLQLDSIAVAGARTHGLVLMSRLERLDPTLAEELLQPGEPLFEYLGHEACWQPVELYPHFEFRRRELRDERRWGGVVTEFGDVARRLLRTIESEGPMRSLDFDSERFGADWKIKKATLVASALWGIGELAIRERRSFQKVFDLPERVVPDELRRRPLSLQQALPELLLVALDGHGWASRATLADTWRLRNRSDEIDRALDRLADERRVVACDLVDHDGDRTAGWIRTDHLELTSRVDRLRPRRDRGVLLSPFDPELWDRGRVATLFGFDQVLEIYKPAAERVYGYYCLPVLAGDRLVARVDVKCHRKAERIDVLSCRYEGDDPTAADREAVRTAVERHAGLLDMAVAGV